MLIFSLWMIASFCSLVALGLGVQIASLDRRIDGRVNGTTKRKLTLVFLTFLLQIANAVLAWHCERFWQ